MTTIISGKHSQASRSCPPSYKLTPMNKVLDGQGALGRNIGDHGLLTLTRRYLPPTPAKLTVVIAEGDTVVPHVHGGSNPHNKH